MATAAGLLQQTTLLFTSDVSAHGTSSNDVVKIVSSSTGSEGTLTFSSDASNTVDLVGLKDVGCESVTCSGAATFAGDLTVNGTTTTLSTTNTVIQDALQQLALNISDHKST